MHHAIKWRRIGYEGILERKRATCPFMGDIAENRNCSVPNAFEPIPRLQLEHKPFPSPASSFDLIVSGKLVPAA